MRTRGGATPTITRSSTCAEGQPQPAPARGPPRLRSSRGGQKRPPSLLTRHFTTNPDPKLRLTNLSADINNIPSGLNPLSR